MNFTGAPHKDAVSFISAAFTHAHTTLKHCYFPTSSFTKLSKNLQVNLSSVKCSLTSDLKPNLSFTLNIMEDSS